VTEPTEGEHVCVRADAGTEGHGPTRPSVTVIVAPERRPGEAGPLLNALAGQTDGEFELVRPRSCYRQWGTVDPDRRICVGPAIAMNLAAGRASGDVLAFLSPDLEPAPDWIASVRRCFAEAAEARVIAGRTIVRSSQFPAVAEAALECLEPRADGLHCPSALHCAVRREAFVELGGFDESQPPAVLLLHPLGGLPLPDGERVASDARMTGHRGPSRGARDWLRRQYAAGRAAWFSPPRRPLGGRLADLLGAAGRAARLVRRKAQLAPVLALLPIAAAARLMGCALAMLSGGRQRTPTRSPLVAPRSPHLVGPDGPAPVATVVVPVYGCPEWLAVCLAALERQDFAEPYEVLVTLEASDSAAEEFRRLFPQARIIRSAPGAGPGGGRNAAFPVARGDYLAFTDDDCLPEADWLRRLVAACRSRGGDPVRGVVATAFPHSYLSRVQHARSVGAARSCKPVTTAGIGGCNMCLARSLLERTGARFAEGVYGAEEMAFLHELGVRQVLLDPNAVVRDLRRDGVRMTLKRSFRLGRGSGRLRSRLDLRGAVFARHLWLAPLLAPLLFGLTCVRTLRRTPWGVLDLVRFIPMTLARPVLYTVGFIAGALEERRSG